MSWTRLIHYSVNRGSTIPRKEGQLLLAPMGDGHRQDGPRTRSWSYRRKPPGTTCVIMHLKCTIANVKKQSFHLKGPLGEGLLTGTRAKLTVFTPLEILPGHYFSQCKGGILITSLSILSPVEGGRRGGISAAILNGIVLITQHVKEKFSQSSSLLSLLLPINQQRVERSARTPRCFQTTAKVVTPFQG